MEIYDWIYANATLPGDAGDYRIRLCGEGLCDYTDFLTRISIRLLSVDMRADLDRPVSWFAGRLEDSLYLVAAGGTQNALLGPGYPLPSGYRQQFCVLGYGFSGGAEELAQYSGQIQDRDTGMFTPLRTYLWELSNGQQPPKWEGRRSRVQRGPHGIPPDRGPNLFANSPDRNRDLWARWSVRPAALDILTVSDAHKMINLMPDLAVTVIEDIPDSFYAPPLPSTISSKRLKEFGASAKLAESERLNTGGGPLLPTASPPRKDHSFLGLFASTPNTYTVDKKKRASSNTARTQRISGAAGERKARLNRIKRISGAVEVCKTRLDAGRTAIAKEYEQYLQTSMPPERAFLAELFTKWIWLALTVTSEDTEEGQLRNILDGFINLHQEKAVEDAYAIDEYLDTLLRECESLAKKIQKK